MIKILIIIDKLVKKVKKKKRGTFLRKFRSKIFKKSGKKLKLKFGKMKNVNNDQEEKYN